MKNNKGVDLKGIIRDSSVLKMLWDIDISKQNKSLVMLRRSSKNSIRNFSVEQKFLWPLALILIAQDLQTRKIQKNCIRVNLSVGWFFCCSSWPRPKSSWQYYTNGWWKGTYRSTLRAKKSQRQTPGVGWILIIPLNLAKAKILLTRLCFACPRML